MTEPNRVHDVGAFGFRAWRHEARLGHRAHSHHDFEVNHVDRGWCEYVIGGQRVRLTEGRCYLFWATVPHQMVDAASGTELGWVVLPANWLWQWRVPSWAAAALLGGDVLGDAHPEPGRTTGNAITGWRCATPRADRTSGATGRRACPARHVRHRDNRLRSVGRITPSPEE